jgi:hypothetical protein
MAKKKQTPSEHGRLSWDGRLWDRSGQVFECSEVELTRNEAEALLNASDVQVAISWCNTALRWLGPHERRRVWLNELAPNFHDTPGWKPPADAPGQLPFHAEIWRSGGKSVLLITDRD